LIDGGSCINILFTKHITLPWCDPRILGCAAIKFGTEFVRFDVADLESVYHAILGRPGINKFLAIPRYSYMVLKMPGPKGVICLKSDVKHSYAMD
jgi:hypothetical protein